MVFYSLRNHVHIYRSDCVGGPLHKPECDLLATLDKKPRITDLDGKEIWGNKEEGDGGKGKI